MLTESIIKNVTSLSEAKLEELCDSYLHEHGDHEVDEFITYLFNTKQITSNEYKNIQAEEKVEITEFVDLDTIITHDADSKRDETKIDFDISSEQSSKEDIGDYVILESIDEGAMGEIMLAHDKKLGRTVAYKKIHKHVADVPSYMGRFFMEAQVTAQLEHPNIVPIYGLVVKGDMIGYTMKLIQGITLKGLIQETQQQYVDKGEPDEHHNLHARLEHFLKVCDAVHYAHRKGVIHRDLKPLNVMIGPYNEVYVMDWGIAKTIDVDTDTFDGKTRRVDPNAEEGKFDKTIMGQVMGTPAYMSPEQAEGRQDILDHRSDLYALGLILFEIVTFQRAINGKNADEVMMKAKRGIIDPPPVYSKQADAQEQLLSIVKKATQYMPENRYATVAEFADDIRRFMHGEAIHARPESNRQKVLRWISHHRRATINIVILTLFSSMVILAVLMYLYLQTIKDIL